MKRIIISIFFVLFVYGNANAELTESLRDVMANELDAIISECGFGEKLPEARCFILEHMTTALARLNIEMLIRRFDDLTWFRAWEHDLVLSRSFTWSRSDGTRYYGVWLLPQGNHIKVVFIDLDLE